MDTATKTGIDTAKTACKRVLQKTEKTTRDLIGNNVADKITPAGKTKRKGNKEKGDEQMNRKKFI